MPCRLFPVVIDENGAAHVKVEAVEEDREAIDRCAALITFKVKLDQGEYEGIDAYMQQLRRLEVLALELNSNEHVVFLHRSIMSCNSSFLLSNRRASVSTFKCG